jgi:flagellin-like protein
MNDRAVSNTVGIVLLIGMTIASVTALVAIGGAVIDDTRADAERSQMENAISGFSSKASLVGLGEAGNQRFALGRTSNGNVRVAPDAGEVALHVNRTGEPKIELNRTTFGAVVYESDGTEIAYQGGGVWERRDGTSRMISPPEYHYQLETLTFPIVTVAGEGRANGQVSGTVQAGGEGNEWYPIRGNETLSNPLEGGTVLVEVKSRYCAGWETFFAERSQGMIQEACGDDQTLTVDLSVPFSISGDQPVVAESIHGDVPDDWNWEESTVAPSVSPEVEDEIEACASGGCGDPPDGEISAGTYNSSGAESFNNVTFNTSDGDIAVVADGDLTLKDIDIEGDNNVTLYIRDELTIKSSVNDGGNASQLTSLVHSDGSVSFTGSSDYTGVIYAPNSDIDLNGVPQINYEGALVVEDLYPNGNADKMEFVSDPSLNGYQIVEGNRPLTYLHVSENPIEVEFD